MRLRKCRVYTAGGCLALALLVGAALRAADAPAGGPAAQPYTWRNVQIVAGGFVDGIEFSPKQPGLVYARTDIGGAYRWDPTARRWVPLTDWVSMADWNLLGIESIGVDPTDASRVYLAAGTYTNNWAGNGAILRSSDQGRTWQRTDVPFKLGGNEDGRSVGERLAVDPNRNSVLYLGTRHDGLWHSTDYGATWNRVESFPVTGGRGYGIGFVVFDPRSGAPGAPTLTIYLGVDAPGYASLYRSTDSGATWKPVPGQPTEMMPHHGVLDPEGNLYLTFGNGPGPNGMSDGAVWKMNTHDDSWKNITPAVPGSRGEGGFGYAGLSLDAQHPGTVIVSTMDRWGAGDTLFRSTDGGEHWVSLAPAAVMDDSLSPYLNFGAEKPRFGWWIGAMEIDPFDSKHVLFGTGATIWGSDDVTAADAGQPTHWSVAAEGIEETAVIDLVSPSAGAHLLSGLGDIGGFRHDDLAISPRSGMFKNPLLNNTDSIDFAANNPMIVARVGRGGGRGVSGSYSLDGGVTWTPFPAAPQGGREGGSIAVSADGGTLVWTPERTAASYSRDHGVTWTACGGLTGPARLVSDRVNPSRFYALTRDGLFVTTDGGASFTRQAAPGGGGKIWAAPGREGDLWMVANGGLYHSTDAGASFSRLNGVQDARALGFGKAAPGRDYPALYLVGTVGNVAGVFRSDDTGATWVRINDDQHQYGGIGQAITGDPRIYGRVYVGTNGRGIPYGDPQ